jgi:hypothetical protein
LRLRRVINEIGEWILNPQIIGELPRLATNGANNAKQRTCRLDAVLCDLAQEVAPICGLS